MKLYLSPQAADQLDALLFYLELAWSARVRDNFLMKLDRSFRAIQRLPHGFPASEKFAGLR